VRKQEPSGEPPGIGTFGFLLLSVLFPPPTLGSGARFSLPQSRSEPRSFRETAGNQEPRNQTPPPRRSSTARHSRSRLRGGGTASIHSPGVGGGGGSSLKTDSARKADDPRQPGDVPGGASPRTRVRVRGRETLSDEEVDAVRAELERRNGDGRALVSWLPVSLRCRRALEINLLRKEKTGDDFFFTALVPPHDSSEQC